MKQALIKYVPSSAVLEIGNMQKPAISEIVHCSVCPSLQWRTSHKLCVMVHSCLQGQVPQYLVDLCLPVSDVASRQHLRSTSQRLLVLLRHRLQTYSRRAFSVAGPSAWNLLSDNLRDPSVNRDSFRRLLKTVCSLCTEASSALEVYKNALYKSTTLTYLLTCSKKVTHYLRY